MLCLYADRKHSQLFHDRCIYTQWEGVRWYRQRQARWHTQSNKYHLPNISPLSWKDKTKDDANIVYQYIYNVISIEGVAIVYGTKISHRVESDSSSAYHVLIVSNKESYIYYSTVKYVWIFKVIYIRYFLHSL